MNSYKGKRLLILGGGIQCLKVVETAKALGIYAIIADINANKIVIDAADAYFQCSLTDCEALSEWCRNNPVDGIINFCVDAAQHAHQKLCQEYGFPCFGNQKLYHAFTDKTFFKQLLEENNLDYIPTYYENQLENVEYPVFVKPAESSGSRGSSVCFNRKELEIAIKKAKDETRNGNIIIEKYLGNHPDIEVEFLFVEGKAYLIKLVDRILGRAEDGLDRQCICGFHPSKYSQIYFDNVHGKLIKMFKNLGMTNGPVFMQGFVDGNTIRFYDPGIRFAGTEYELSYREETGIDLMKASVIYALTGKYEIDLADLKNGYELNGNCAINLNIDAKPGTINVFEGLEQIRRLSEVTAVSQKAFVGDTIKKTGDIKQRVVEIDVVVEKNRTSIKKLIDKIYSILRVEDENGNDMLVSLVDPAKLI